MWRQQDSEVVGLTVEARVAIRRELQGQQKFRKFCWERDPGRENRMGFMGSNRIQNEVGLRTRLFLRAGKGKSYQFL